jgi:hypothetical protein
MAAYSNASVHNRERGVDDDGHEETVGMKHAQRVDLTPAAEVEPQKLYGSSRNPCLAT